MSETKKKSGAEKAIDKAEARARAKVVAALTVWRPLREAQHALMRDTCHDLDAAADLVTAWATGSNETVEAES